MIAKRALVLLFAIVSLAARPVAAKKAPPKAVAVNVTGTYNTTFPGAPELVLRQKGNLVVGKAAGNFVRGDWSDGMLTIFFRDGFRADGECAKPLIYVFTSKGVATRLDGVTWSDAGEKADGQALVRNSPDGGPELDYPYAVELKDCHALIAHDLVFATGSDKLTNTDSPVLAGAADALKKDAP
jgi:hypothetical protein